MKEKAKETFMEQRSKLIIEIPCIIILLIIFGFPPLRNILRETNALAVVAAIPGGFIFEFFVTFFMRVREKQLYEDQEKKYRTHEKF